MIRFAIFLSLGLAAPPLSIAQDGALEINQACVAQGCFAGDDNGFPVQITQPGSYRLTGNLDISQEANAEDLDVIDISANDVNLDLGGFSLIGPVACDGTPVTSCAPSSGLGSGITIDGGLTGIGVRNGTVRGMGKFGVLCIAGAQCTYESITAIENGLRGIGNGVDASVKAFDCNLIRNGDVGGAFTGDVSNCRAVGNGDVGISVFDGSVTNSAALDNESNGFELVRTLGSENMARGNGGHGFDLNESSLRESSARENARSGVRCAYCLLMDNFVTENSDYGVRFFAGAKGWKGNLLFDNTPADSIGAPSPSNLGANLCDDGSC